MRSGLQPESPQLTAGVGAGEDGSAAGVLAKAAEIPAKLHLTFIDGMRGCAASYIVFHHALEMSGYRPTNALMRMFALLLGQGHTVVTIFIGISGFCLGLPAARGGMKLAGGAKKFFKGRVHRILPPYYLALALSIVVVVLLVPAGGRWAYLRSPAMEFSMLMHVLLIQNLNMATFYGINGPLWSIAMECQIYLFFPLMVLAWRRFGMVAALAGIFVLAHAAFHLTGDQIPFNYMFTFALGMAAAVSTVERRAEGWLLWVCGLSLVGFVLTVEWRVVASDLCVGVLMATLMAMLSVGRLGWLRRLLSLRLLTWVGMFSYSLYLIHALLQDWYLSTAFSARHTGQLVQVLVMFLVVSPANFGVAYLFYQVGEKPFLNRKKRIVEAAYVEPVRLPEGSAVEA